MSIKPTVILKGEHGSIQVVGTSYKEELYVDVRNFYLEKTSGEFKPTPKGIMIPLNKVDEVIEAIKTQAKFLQGATTKKPKLYVVTSKPIKFAGKAVKFPADAIYEDFLSAKKHKPRSEGLMIFALVGDFKVSGDSYTFQASTKKRKVATFLNGAWVKPTT